MLVNQDVCKSELPLNVDMKKEIYGGSVVVFLEEV